MSDDRTAVAEFLRKCNVYAQASIERKRARGEEEEIAKWVRWNVKTKEAPVKGTVP